jgi:F-type H+-transporting ATPase subunit gamma
MAKARALDKRRKSIRNIRKITRTMELISTARFKRAMDRATAGAAYARRVTALVGHLARLDLEIRHPLLEQRAEPRRALLLVLTANRGLCGGYNSAVTRLAMARWKQLQQEIPENRLEVSGKRGIGAFRFRGIEPDERFRHFEDRPAYAEVELLANRYLQAFVAGQLDRFDVVYTKFESMSRMFPVAETLLPLTAVGGSEQAESEAEPAAVQYDFLPSAESILDEIVPMSFKVRLFKCFLDAAVTEHVSRMMAMKAATENADTMISHLTMTYNRARQGQITNEILEVIGGAEALTG